MVFAAKAEADSTAASTAASTGTSSASQATASSNAGQQLRRRRLGAEEACSLNSDPAKDAEDPRVAAGTMNPANPTAPWVTWDETVGGVHQVFVSRLVATPTPHFEIVNGGAPISTRRRRVDAPGHHVLGQHAVRDLA